MSTHLLGSPSVNRIARQNLRQAIHTALDEAGAAGERFGVTDLSTGAVAREVGGLVWSLDSDFLRVERLGFVGLCEPARWLLSSLFCPLVVECSPRSPLD
jgi:hypothetical protein